MGDLWYHALKFLDKYRTDIQTYDVSDLYEFADTTGILERHKQLLSEPFKEGQVDMKIMYYELIRMLIDYERKNHPQTYDATKTVGKIEGYQELTNKLQRYLNQRFIEDIELLSKEQGSITNINISSKFEHLEETITNLDAKYSTLTNSLQKTINNLTEENVALTSSHSNLEQEYSSLQNKYLAMESNNLAIQEKITVFETNEKTLFEEIRRLKATEQKLMDERKAFEEKTEMANTTREAEHKRALAALQQSEAEMQVKIQHLEKADAFNQECQNQLSEKTTSSLTEMSGLLQKIEKRVENNEERSILNTAGVQRNSEKINKLADLQANITDKIESKYTDTWNAIDKIIASHSETIGGVKDLIEINKDNIAILKEQNQKQIESVNELFKVTNEKVLLLEEAHQKQLQKNDYYDSLKLRLLRLTRNDRNRMQELAMRWML